ncbi:MAG: hypothetical protein GQ564_09655 [Bacteroidales bacterium]|nr:hypothetical protein [Bacteroidales bacterium]
MNRRKFITTIGRGTILSGLAAISGILIFRNSKEKDLCTYDFVCKECQRLKSCTQPEAIILKRKKAKNSVSNG